jgi:pre-mRNA-splicing factor 38A
MANTTAKVAKTIHGTNPQFLVERVIRGRIYDSMYWKEHCFALTAESLIDKALSLTCIGGTYGIQRPTEFLCLVCKLLQIQPEKDIILEYLQFEEFKYLRAVVAMYVRLAFSSLEVYEVLEPMLNDYRKLRFRQMSGSYYITFMDEYINDLLTKERVCELILPRLTRRDVLEDTEGLAPRSSKLEDALLVGDQDSDAASDDSTALIRKQKKERLKKAERVRQEKEAHKLARLKSAKEVALEDRQEDRLSELEEEGFASQEDSDGEEGYISRSPSISGSEKGYQSRSPSRSPDREGYISRSVSRSPDRS